MCTRTRVDCDCVEMGARAFANKSVINCAIYAINSEHENDEVADKKKENRSDSSRN